MTDRIPRPQLHFHPGSKYVERFNQLVAVHIAESESEGDKTIVAYFQKLIRDAWKASGKKW